MNNNGISVIIVTHNNFSNKNGCIETVLYSIANQKFDNYEIIVVDNNSSKLNRLKLQELSNYLKDLRLAFNDKNNIASARNVGSHMAKYENLLYMDDDMILPNDCILKKIANYARKYKYGYSAIRKWTSQDWYKNNKRKINDVLLKNLKCCDIITKEPDPCVRYKSTNRHLIRTYIGNFGFVNKKILQDVGYWDEKYIGYGCEDDDLAFKLYLKFGLPFLMTDVEVIHVWHSISKTNLKQCQINQQRFKDLLDKYYVKIFHIGRILYNEKNVLELKMEGN